MSVHTRYEVKLPDDVRLDLFFTHILLSIWTVSHSLSHSMRLRRVCPTLSIHLDLEGLLLPSHNLNDATG